MAANQTPQLPFQELSELFICSLKEIKYLRSVIQTYSDLIPEFAAIDLLTFNDNPNVYKHLLYSTTAEVTDNRHCNETELSAPPPNVSNGTQLLSVGNGLQITKAKEIATPNAAVDPQGAIFLDKGNEGNGFFLKELSVVKSLLMIHNLNTAVTYKSLQRFEDPITTADDTKKEDVPTIRASGSSPPSRFVPAYTENTLDALFNQHMAVHSALQQKIRGGNMPPDVSNGHWDSFLEAALIQILQKLEMLNISINLLRTDFSFKCHQIASFSVKIIAHLRSNIELHAEEFRILKERLSKLSNATKIS